MALTQITEKGIKDGEILNADINANAAIAGTKISPDFGSQNIVTTGSISGAAGTFTGDLTIPDKIVHTGDTDTAIRLGVDTITAETAGSERIRINSSGDVGIGTTSPAQIFHVKNTGAHTTWRIENDNADFLIQAGDAGADGLHFYDFDNSAYRMTIANSGRVGIGTSSPAGKLHVSDVYHFLAVGGNATTGMKIGNYDGSSYGILTTRGSQLRFDIGDNNKMVLDASGKLGIGTSSPNQELHVKGAGTVATFEGTGGSSFIGIKDSDDSTIAFVGVDGGNLKFQTSGSSYSDKLVINTSGNVGIGTSSPQEILHVKAASEAINTRDGVIFGSTDSLAADKGLPLVWAAHIGTDADYGIASICGRKENATNDNGAGYLQFGTGTAAGAIEERMRIDSSGKVLIGVSSSVSNEAILQAFGTTNASFIFGSTATSATGTATINMCPSNSITGGQIVCTATEDFSVSANRSANLKFNVRLNGTFYTALNLNTSAQALFESITNSGNHFQINNTTTSNTGTMLNINSSRNTTNGSYYLAQWGSTSTTRFQVLDSGNCANINNSFSAISDQTLKENIVDAGSQWDDIKNLKVRKFNFIEATDPDKKTMLGVVAQEAETVCPNLVETISTKQNGEEKEVKSFKYSILYMKAIKCLQEAITKIEVLEAKVAALESGS